MPTSIIASPGSGGTDEPPGMTALSRRPPRTPPASSRRSRNGVPSGTSKFPGRLTCPDTEKHFTPPLFGRPRPMNQSPPLRMIDGTEAKVSVGRRRSPSSTDQPAHGIAGSANQGTRSRSHRPRTALDALTAPGSESGVIPIDAAS